MNLRSFGRVGLALLIGALSGWAAQYLGLPLPWMIGPMIGVTAAALSGAPIGGPDTIRPVVIPVLGVMLGSSLTPEVFAALGRWIITLAFLVPFLVATATVAYLIYRRIGKYDQVTAYFCAMPGGLNDMIVLGVAAGGIERRIALAHAVRIFVVIMFVVLFFGLVLGVRSGGAAGNWVGLAQLSVMDWLILGICAVAGVVLGTLSRLPAAPIFGPMLLSGAAHVTQIVEVAPPSVLVIVAQLVVGTVLGCRFLGATLREVGRDILLGVMSSLAMVAMAVVFALMVGWTTGVQISQAFLAFSPGGLAEMTLLALAMGQDVAYVSVLHVVRIALVIGGAGVVFGWVKGRKARPF